jgi:hypothetical protein
MIQKSLVRYDFRLPIQPEVDPIAVDARDGCRGNPLWLPLEGRHGGLPLQFDPLPTTEGEEVIGDLPVQYHLQVI